GGAALRRRSPSEADGRQHPAGGGRRIVLDRHRRVLDRGGVEDPGELIEAVEVPGQRFGVSLVTPTQPGADHLSRGGQAHHRQRTSESLLVERPVLAPFEHPRATITCAPASRCTRQTAPRAVRSRRLLKGSSGGAGQPRRSLSRSIAAPGTPRSARTSPIASITVVFPTPTEPVTTSARASRLIAGPPGSHGRPRGRRTDSRPGRYPRARCCRARPHRRSRWPRRPRTGRA